MSDGARGKKEPSTMRANDGAMKGESESDKMTKQEKGSE